MSESTPKTQALIEQSIREERGEALAAEQVLPFSLSCSECDVEPLPLANCVRSAEGLGWTHITYNNGASWNFLGLCPECKAAGE